MILYRFSKLRFLDDLSGMGAKLYGGRWNSRGNPVLYTSGTAALALLEFICNAGDRKLAGKTGIAEIEVPADIEQISERNLPDGWQRYPAPDELKAIGDKWLQSGKSLLLKVPSAVMPLEWNFLVNPLHKHTREIKIKRTLRLDPDDRLLKA
jgi:RES domain-containing protein